MWGAGAPAQGPSWEEGRGGQGRLEGGASRRPETLGGFGNQVG